VAARGEEVEEALADLVTCHSFILAKAERLAGQAIHVVSLMDANGLKRREFEIPCYD